MRVVCVQMAEVVSPKDKTSLLQFIVKQLYEKEPVLCSFYEEVPSLEAASAGECCVPHVRAALSDVLLARPSLLSLGGC